MRQAHRPESYPLPTTPWVLLGGLWTAVAAVWLLWFSGRFAGLLGGRGWANGPGFGSEFFSGLLRGEWSQLWPGVSPGLVMATACMVFLFAAAPVILVWRWVASRRVQPGDPLPSLAQPADLVSLSRRGVAKRARHLRLSLAAVPVAKIAPNDAGVFLGTLRPSKQPVFAALEDVIVAVMAPRTGKTTAIAAPVVLAAPGPVVATGNKSDLWALTANPRAGRGRVWVFDPQSIAHYPQQWWWDPLGGVSTVDDAHRLALHFIQELKGDRRDFWSSAAHGLLTGLLLAAACGGGTVRDVYAWINDATNPEPGELLRKHGFPEFAAELFGRQNITPETRDGVYETARTAAQCLRDPAILRWVTPDSGAAVTFDAAAFVRSTDTLHLLSKEGAGSSAPLVAALTDRVFRAGVARAEASGGRLDPPLLVVLDEAANVCRIADLPELYSHLGSRGIIPITILQSYQQAARVWGTDGVATLWSAATIKLIGAGIDDPRLAEDISRLTGEHDVAVASYSRGHRDTVSESVSLRRERVLPPDSVRALPKGTALLLATGIRPALIDLVPWYEAPYADQISAGQVAAVQTIIARATANDNGGGGGK